MPRGAMRGLICCGPVVAAAHCSRLVGGGRAGFAIAVVGMLVGHGSDGLANHLGTMFVLLVVIDT